MDNSSFSDFPENSPALHLGQLLSEKNMTCAVAESCTGGMIGGAITTVAGSSEWFRGGVIAYTNDIKIKLLGVSAETLKKKGAVSAETVVSMAVGAAHFCEADCSIAVSGIAGPSGGTPEKPVGLVYIGCWVNGKATAIKHHFSGDRTAVRTATIKAALEHLINQLQC
jgi:PncC family amidohydrolase